MNAEEFDSLMRARPFGTEDARRAEAQLRREMTLLSTLGAALWGRTSGDLQSQLLKPCPEIPAGFDLPDFRELLRLLSSQMLSDSLAVRKAAGLSPLALSAPSIFVGSQGFTEWEARYEVVRRAIEYLEKR